MPAGSLDAARPLAAPFAGPDPHRCEPTLYGVATTSGSVTSHALTRTRPGRSRRPAAVGSGAGAAPAEAGIRAPTA
jgi:hypothetical protein